MLGHAHLETFAHINSHAPAPLYTDRVERPGVECLREVFAEHESRLSKEEEAAQLGSAEGPDFKVSGKHVAGKGVAGIVHSPRNSRVGAAQVRINLVVRGREIELSVAPEHVTRKEHAIRGSSRSASLGRRPLCR